MSGKRVVVYTCITGGYDELRDPLVVEPGVDYICFADGPLNESRVWEILPIPDRTGKYSRDNRYVKMHPHILFPEYDASVYVDGNVRVKGNVESLAESALQLGEIALFSHAFRGCVYEEAEACARLGRDWYWRIKNQMREYSDKGFPRNAGLFECNVILRRHGADVVKSLMAAWWDLYLRGVPRDQLSLTYLAWTLGVNIVNLGENDQRIAKRYFDLNPRHKKRRPYINYGRGLVNRLLIAVSREETF